MSPKFKTFRKVTKEFIDDLDKKIFTYAFYIELLYDDKIFYHYKGLTFNGIKFVLTLLAIFVT